MPNRKNNKTNTNFDIPKNISEAFIYSFWNSRWRRPLFIIVVLFFIVFMIWNTLPDESKLNIISTISINSMEKDNTQKTEKKSGTIPNKKPYFILHEMSEGEIVKKIKEWRFVGDEGGYSTGIDYDIKHNGDYSAYIKSKGASKPGSLTYNIFNENIYRGKTIKFSAYIRVNSIEIANLFTSAYSLGVDKFKFIDSEDENLIDGPTSWNYYEVIFNIPQNTDYISFGIFLNGKGEIWIDDVALEVMQK